MKLLSIKTRFRRCPKFTLKIPAIMDSRLEELALRVNSLSRKYACLPSRRTVIIDLLEGLRRFRNSVRWKYFWKFGLGKELLENSENEDEIFSALGFETGLRHQNTVNCNHEADRDTENFLHTFVRQVLRSVPEHEPEAIRKMSSHDHLVQNFTQKLSETADIVFVPSDKTGKFVPLSLKNYKNMLQYHLKQSCVPVTTQTLKQLQIEAHTRLESISSQITKNEHNYVKETIKSSDVPCGKLLVKDHKTGAINYGNGTIEYESRFVIPCSNYLACFSKLGYKAIESIFKKNKISFEKTNIKNSYELIHDLETMNITESTHTIISYDVTNMYPNIKQSYIKTAIDHFSSSFSPEDKERISLAWETARFGMRNVILRHRDEYFQFRGADGDGSDPGLAIGSFESAFFSDMVMGYLFEKMKNELEKECVYFKIYRDDALLVFRGVKSDRKLDRWHRNTSAKICEFMPSISFTMTKWCFGLPFLDIFLSWDENSNLTWKTYTKPNATTKYLNKTSPGHTFSCTKAIPHSVVERLAKLTKKDPKLELIRITDHYPDHRNALVDAGLCMIDKTPLEATFGEKWAPKPAQPTKKHQTEKRTIHFVSSYIGNYLKEPIHVTLKRLREIFNVKWLHVRMCHKRFSSIENRIQGDLRSKVDKGVISDDYCDWTCNCGQQAKRDGECIWNGKCRAKCVIYHYKCLKCAAEYVGSTQQPCKKRLGQHCGDARRFVYKDEKSDKFADHFGKHRIEVLEDDGRTVEDRIEELEEKKRKGEGDDEISKIRAMVKPGILWDGNGLTVGRSFGKDSCMLCNMEKFYLFDRRRVVKVLNQNNEFFAKCRHVPRIQKLFTEEAYAENGNRSY